MRSKICFMSTAMLVMLSGVLSAMAVPIAGTTYTYDLSQADPGTGIFTTPNASADDTATLSILTDGDFGSLVPSSGGAAVFPNGTYAGFVNNGFGGAPQPKIDIDLNGSYNLSSFTLYALIEPSSTIFAPQPQTGIDALTVSGSTDGVNFSVLGSSNAYPPVDFNDPTQVVSATVNLGGASATHLSVDVRTPFSFIFLSEYVVEAVPEPATASLLGLCGTALLMVRRRHR